MVQVPVMGGRAIRDDEREGRLRWGRIMRFQKKEGEKS